MRRFTKQRGISLVELLFGLFLATMAGLVFTAILPMASKTEKMLSYYEQASSFGQHKIDQMRAVGYGRLTQKHLEMGGIIDASPTVAPFSFKTIDDLPSIFPKPKGTIEIFDHTSKVRRVRVTIEWSGSLAKQANGKLVVEALIAQ